MRLRFLLGLLPLQAGTSFGALAQTCPADTTRGALVVEINPGPNGEIPAVAVTGPGNFSASIQSTTTYDDVPAGPYRVRLTGGERVIVDGVPIGRAWSPLVRGTPGCVRGGQTARIAAAYAEEPGSRKVWVIDDLGNAAFSIVPERFATKGPAAPGARLELGTNKARAVAFDPAGNMWVSDISGQILSLGVWTLGRSGPVRPRISWTGASVADPVALAFDAEGGLWVASRQQHVTRFAPDQLQAARAPLPQLTIPVPDPSGLAFDADGNLWVASAGRNPAVLRYDANRLDRPGPPNLAVVAMSPPPVIGALSGPAGMVFDRDGNLWVGYFGPNVIARLTPSDLRASGEITPGIQLNLAVGVLLEALAFDETGALWVPGESGQVARLAPEQLRESGLVTPRVLLMPEGLRYGVGLAINPGVSWSRANP